MPTPIVVAGRSRAHDAVTVAARARQHLPNVKVAELPGATHHTIPITGTTELLAVLRPFLDADGPAAS